MRCCAYCGRTVSLACMSYRGKDYHVLEDENGNKVEHDQCCWAKSEEGQKTLQRKDHGTNIPDRIPS